MTGFDGIARVLPVFLVCIGPSATTSASIWDLQTRVRNSQLDLGLGATRMENFSRRADPPSLLDRDAVDEQAPVDSTTSSPLLTRGAADQDHERQSNFPPLSEEQAEIYRRVYRYYSGGNAETILSCVRLIPRPKRQKAMQKLCDGLRSTLSDRRLCERVTSDLLNAINSSSAVVLRSPFPTLFRDIPFSLETPYTPKGSFGTYSMHIANYINSCSGSTTQASDTCQGIVARRTLFGQQSAYMPVNSRREKLQSARVITCLLLGMSPPLPDPIVLGALARLTDTSNCRRARKTWPDPPVHTSRAEVLVRAWGFGISHAVYPSDLNCTVESLHPTCLLLRSHTNISRTMLALIRSGDFEDTSALEQSLAEEEYRITTEEMHWAQFEAQIHLAELATLGITSRERMVRLGLWIAKSRRLSRFIGKVVAFFRPFFRSIGLSNLESRARKEGLSDLLHNLTHALLIQVGATSYCMTASKGLQNLVMDAGKRLLSRLRSDTISEPHEGMSFLQTEHPHTSASKSFPATSLIEERERPNTPWYKFPRRAVAMTILGALLSPLLLAALFTPLINPLVFLFLGVGFFGLVVFVTFSIVLVHQRILLRAEQEAVLKLSQGSDREPLLGEARNQYESLQERTTQ